MIKFFKVFMVSVLVTMIFSLTLTTNSEAVSRKKAEKVHDKAYNWMQEDGRMLSVSDKEAMKHYKKLIDFWNGVPYPIVYKSLDKVIGRSLFANKMTAVVLCKWADLYYDDLIYGSKISGELDAATLANTTSLFNIKRMKARELLKLASEGNVVKARKLIYNVEKYYNKSKSRGLAFDGDDSVRKKVCKR